MQTRRDTLGNNSSEMLSSARAYVRINDEKTKGKLCGVFTNWRSQLPDFWKVKTWQFQPLVNDILDRNSL